jgi:peptidoglycan/LPS O-acetylase OafA/YrhL
MVHWLISELVKTVWLDRYHVAFGTNFETWQAAIALIILMPTVLLTASLTYRFVEIPMRSLIKTKA